MVGRGLRCRCPNCGAGSLFESYTRLRPACATCGLRLDRGEADYFLGAFTVNFVTAELLLVALLAIVVVLSWPEVPWAPLLRAGIALMILAPILFFPVSRTLWLALDLTFREARPEDFARADRPRH